MSTLKIGQNFSNYVILEEIGSGGMGKVYKAWDEKLNRHVAIKVLNPDTIPKKNFSEWFKRFVSEARTLAQINHTNVMSIFDISDDDDQPYLVMEYLEGIPLYNHIKMEKLSIKSLLLFFKTLANSFAHIHELGILHRDIKPANIMVTKSGAPKIIDFGISKWSADPNSVETQGHQFVGSIHYSAPELFDFQKADQRIDIFAFGVTLANILNGQRIFDGEDAQEVIHSIKHIEPAFSENVEKNLPSPLLGFLQCLVEKDPQDRYQNMLEVEQVIDSLLSGLQSDFLECNLSQLQDQSIKLKNDGVKSNIKKNEVIYTMTLNKGDLEVNKKKSRSSRNSKKRNVKRRKSERKEHRTSKNPLVWVASLTLVTGLSIGVYKINPNLPGSTIIESIISTTSSSKNEIKSIQEFIITLEDAGEGQYKDDLIKLERNLIASKEIDPEMYQRLVSRVEEFHEGFKQGEDRDYKSLIERGNLILENIIQRNSSRSLSSESSK